MEMPTLFTRTSMVIPSASRAAQSASTSSGLEMSERNPCARAPAAASSLSRRAIAAGEVDLGALPPHFERDVAADILPGSCHQRPSAGKQAIVEGPPIFPDQPYPGRLKQVPRLAAARRARLRTLRADTRTSLCFP
jgi:hypothetical protein